MTYADGNPGLCLGQTQKCDSRGKYATCVKNILLSSDEFIKISSRTQGACAL